MLLAFAMALAMAAGQPVNDDPDDTTFSERGGSMEPLVYEECRERLTRARVAELRGDETP